MTVSEMLKEILSLLAVLAGQRKTDAADRTTAERSDESPAEEPQKEKMTVVRTEEPATQLPDRVFIPTDEAEKLAPRFDELSAKLDDVLAAVKRNGEQIRKIAERDGGTIFFS